MRTVAVLLLLVAAQAFGWQERLADPVSRYFLNAPDLSIAIDRVAAAFGFPVGIEWIRTPETVRPVSLSWKQTTVGAILADVVKAYPGYLLETGGAVVRVRHQALDGDAGDVLNYRLDNFYLSDQTISMASAELSDQLGPIMRGDQPVYVHSIIESGNDPKFTILRKHTLVRDILDDLLLYSGRVAWVVSYPAELNRTSTGFLKMLQWNSDKAAEDKQFAPFFEFREVPMVGRPR
jgi:hypothetical protein